MRVRSNSVFASSVLHTVALLFFVWAGLWKYFSAGGFILIGLIVVWTGYVKRSRSAWLLMCAIVWFWAFPIFVFPFLAGAIGGRLEVSLSESKTEVAFLLMVTGLVVPIRKFFPSRRVGESQHPPKAMLT